VPLPLVAYIDVGIGGLLMQLLLGGVAGLAAFARLKWKSIRGKVAPTASSSASSLGQASDIQP
jgi:hypothetical protein